MNTRHPYRAAFISDLDGTLRHGADGVSAEDYAAFVNLSGLGVARIIATGRAMHSVKDCLAVDFPIDYVIASSGNQIIDWRTQDVLHSNSMSNSQALRVQQILLDLGLCFMVHRDFPNNHYFMYYCGQTVPPDFTRRVAIHALHGSQGLMDEEWNAVSQFVIIVEGECYRLVDQLRAVLPEFSIIRATSPLDGQSLWIEVFAAQVSKATGIQRLLRHLEFAGQPLGAIGNDFNDTDMLDFVHFPYIVPGAFIEDRQYLRTPSGQQNAVAYAVTHFIRAIRSGWPRE